MVYRFTTSFVHTTQITGGVLLLLRLTFLRPYSRDFTQGSCSHKERHLLRRVITLYTFPRKTCAAGAS